MVNYALVAYLFLICSIVWRRKHMSFMSMTMAFGDSRVAVNKTIFYLQAECNRGCIWLIHDDFNVGFSYLISEGGKKNKSKAKRSEIAPS